jgi:hypothetical protein
MFGPKVSPTAFEGKRPVNAREIRISTDFQSDSRTKLGAWDIWSRLSCTVLNRVFAVFLPGSL